MATSVDIGDLKIDLVLASDQFDKAVGEAIGRMGDLSGGLQKSSASFADIHFALQDFGSALSGIGSAVSQATSSYAEFEQGLARIKALGVEKDIDAIGDEVLALTEQFGADKRQLIDSYYGAISAGIEEANIPEFLATATKAAEATGSSVSDVNEAMLTMMEQFGQTATSASDSLMTIAREGRTNLGELSKYIGDVAPVASAAGLSIEDLGGGLIAATKAIGDTGKAVTGMRQLLVNVVKPTKQASDTAEALGINFSTAAIESMGLSNWLQHVQQKTGGNVETMGQLFGSVEALNVALGLMQGNAKNVTEGMAAMGQAAGETDRQYAQVGETLQTATSKMNASFERLRTEFGQANESAAIFSATTKGFVYSTLADWLSANDALSSSFGYVTTGIGELGGALGGLTSVGQFIFSMKQISEILPLLKFGAIATQISTMGTALTATATSLGAMAAAAAGPIIVFGAIAAGAAAVGYSLWRWHEAEQALMSAQQARNAQSLQELDLANRLADSGGKLGRQYAELTAREQELERVIADNNTTIEGRRAAQEELREIDKKLLDIRREANAGITEEAQKYNAAKDALVGKSTAATEAITSTQALATAETESGEATLKLTSQRESLTATFASSSEGAKTAASSQKELSTATTELESTYKSAMESLKSSTASSVDANISKIKELIDEMKKLKAETDDMAGNSWWPDAMATMKTTTAEMAEQSVAAVGDLSDSVSRHVKSSLLDLVRLQSELARSGATNAFHGMRRAKEDFRSRDGGSPDTEGTNSVPRGDSPSVTVNVHSGPSRDEIKNAVTTELDAALTGAGV